MHVAGQVIATAAPVRVVLINSAHSHCGRQGWGWGWKSYDRSAPNFSATDQEGMVTWIKHCEHDQLTIFDPGIVVFVAQRGKADAFSCSCNYLSDMR